MNYFLFQNLSDITILNNTMEIFITIHDKPDKISVLDESIKFL